MARFSNAAIGSLSQSITQAPRPPIEIVAAADDKAGYSLTNTDAATTQIRCDAGVWSRAYSCQQWW